MKTRAVIRGIGSYLPPRIVTNAELTGSVETSEEWIVQRTGIRQRHVADDGDQGCGSRAGARRLHRR